jgi:hypothetical protein
MPNDWQQYDLKDACRTLVEGIWTGFEQIPFMLKVNYLLPLKDHSFERFTRRNNM